MYRPLLATVACLMLANAASAQGFEKKTIDNGNWNTGRFADAVTVRTPAKFIYLSGQGAEDEKTGKILHLGDVAEQCKYAWEKIDKMLAQQGAKVSDIVKATTYVTDARFQQTIGECRRNAMKGAPATPHTFLVVQALAWPGMLMEVDIVAAVAP